jgi:hypothetical protein
MVDENPPPGEAAPAPPVAEQAAEAPEQAEQAAAPPPESPPVVEQPLAESERERWLRGRFEREHEFTLALMRLLLEGLSSESRAMRFWRWLIDDLRSERRITAELGEPGDRERLLLRRVLAWFRERGFDRSNRSPPATSDR